MLLGFHSFIATGVAVIFGARYFSSTCQIIKETNNGEEQKTVVKQTNLDFLNYNNKKSEMLAKADEECECSWPLMLSML